MQCIVSGCENNASTSYAFGITFYMVPTEPTLRKKWFRALGADGCVAPEVSMVCSDHFLAKDLYITKGGQRRLRADALPVVQYLPKCVHSMGSCDIKVCRICFATDCKLYSMVNHVSLQHAFAALAGMMTEDEDGLPPYLCTMCAHRLLECARFKTKSIRAYWLLVDLVKKHHRITLETIKSAHGSRLNNSSLSVTRKIDHYDLDIVHVKEEIENIDEEYSDTDNRNEIENSHEHSHESGKIKVRNNVVEILKKGGTSNERSSPSNLHDETDLDVVKMEDDSDDSDDDIDVDKNDETEEVGKPVIVYIKSEKLDEVSDSPEDMSDEDVSLARLRGGGEAKNGSSTNKKLKKDHSKGRYGDFGQSSRKTGQGTMTSTKKEVSHPKWIVREPKFKSMYLKSKFETQSSKNCSCNVCYKEFKSNFNLQKHLRLHFNVNAFTCEYCKKTFDLESKLKRHVAIHNRKSFVCGLCSKSFKNESNLEIHLRIHNGEKPYICDICKATFRDKSDLRKHLKNHEGIKPYCCDLCAKSFSIKSKLKRHVMTHFYKKQYKCHICSQSFRGETNLALHLQVHEGLKPFSCDLCKATFKDKRDLRKHAIIHTGIKPFSCDLCDKSFVMKSKLRRHIMTHVGTKPYKCQVCSKAFSEKGNLQKHSRIHTNTKAYSCEVCKKSFIENSVLKRHMKVHAR